MMSGRVLEMAPITLRPDADLNAFLEASERLEREFLSEQPGYLGRALTQDGRGRWMDIVLWQDQAAADAIMTKIPASDACAAYFGFMEGADVTAADAGIEHLRVTRGFGAFAAS